MIAAQRTIIISSDPASLTYAPAGLSCEITVEVSPPADADLSIDCTPNGIAELNVDTLTITGAGTITVTATVAADDNYAKTTQTHDVIVAKAVQTITFDIQSSAGQGETFSATVSSLSGGAMAISSSNASVVPWSNSNLASATATTLTAGSVGTATLTAEQTGTDNYLAATATTTVEVYQEVDNLDANSDDIADSVTAGDVTASTSSAKVTDTDGSTADGAGYALDSTGKNKFLRVEVPNYTAGHNSAPSSYLQLGSAPSSSDGSTLVARGDDLLAAVGLPTTNGKFFRDDYRITEGQQHPSVVYQKDTGVGSPASSSSSPASFVHQMTNSLTTRGGWREHSDGNRITTTRGDRVEVIGGNYKMVVLGRRWQRAAGANNDTFSKHDWGESYWESSGGHNKDGTNTPGEVVNIAWDTSSNPAGEWRVVEETINGNTIEEFFGNRHETTKAREIVEQVGPKLSYEGASPPTVVDKPDTAIATITNKEVQEQDPNKGWLTDASIKWQTPTITETTYAKAISGTTEVFYDGVSGGWIKEYEEVGTKTENVTIKGNLKSKTLAEVQIDHMGSVASPVPTFSESLTTTDTHSSKEFFVTKMELTAGGDLKTNHGAGFAFSLSGVLEASAGVSANCWINCFTFGLGVGWETGVACSATLDVVIGARVSFEKVIEGMKNYLTSTQLAVGELNYKTGGNSAHALSSKSSAFKFWL